jgi:predicted nucleic acid-binding protein
VTIVVDTTVLVYAVGDDHELRQPAQALVEAAAAGALVVTTTPEVIQEFAHMRARRRGREDAARLAARFADLLSPLVEVGERDLRNGLELFARHERLGAFDAVLTAVAIRRDASVLVSADGAYGSVAGLRFRALAGLEIEDLAPAR